MGVRGLSRNLTKRRPFDLLELNIILESRVVVDGLLLLVGAIVALEVELPVLEVLLGLRF